METLTVIQRPVAITEFVSVSTVSLVMVQQYVKKLKKVGENGVSICLILFNVVTVSIFLLPDLCTRVQCAENAECEAGLCQCKPGFKGDGFAECTPIEVDPGSYKFCFNQNMLSNVVKQYCNS